MEFLQDYWGYVVGLILLVGGILLFMVRPGGLLHQEVRSPGPGAPTEKVKKRRSVQNMNRMSKEAFGVEVDWRANKIGGHQLDKIEIIDALGEEEDLVGDLYHRKKMGETLTADEETQLADAQTKINSSLAPYLREKERTINREKRQGQRRFPVQLADEKK